MRQDVDGLVVHVEETIEASFDILERSIAYTVVGESRRLCFNTQKIMSFLPV